MLGKRLAAYGITLELEAGRRRAVFRKAIGTINRSVATWLERYLIFLAALRALDLVHLADAPVAKASACSS